MNSNHIDPEDLALFALQFLTDEESAAIRQHLEGCAACSEQLAEAQGDLACYALTAEMHSPPAAARDRLLQAVARERKPSPAASAATGIVGTGAAGRQVAAITEIGQRSSGSRSSAPARSASPGRPASERQGFAARVIPWLGWAVAAGLAVTAGQILHERDALRNDVQSTNQQMAALTTQTSEARRLLETLNDPSAQRVTLNLSKHAPVPQAKATYVPERGALVFVASNMEALKPYKTYELWIIPASGQDPVPAGIFKPDAHGDASLILPNLPQGVAAKAFGITIEDDGGSKSPTMPILLAGSAGL